MTKPWYRSRILWLNAFTAGAGAAIAAGCVSVAVAGWLTTVIAVVNVVLRYDTDQGIE